MRIDKVSAIVLTLAIGGLAQPVCAQEVKHLFFEGDMVRGAQQGAPGPFCVLDSAGKPLDGSGLKTVVVELPDGQKVDAKYGQHPPPSQGPAADYFWTAIWIIPSAYPTGSLSYKVTATDLDGNAQTWEPFKTKPARLMVVDGEIEIKKPQ